METYSEVNDTGEKLRFKSYYVVWKHTGKNEFVRYLNTFKSYYVVWKHI